MAFSVFELRGNMTVLRYLAKVVKGVDHVTVNLESALSRNEK